MGVCGVIRKKSPNIQAVQVGGAPVDFTEVQLSSEAAAAERFQHRGQLTYLSAAPRSAPPPSAPSALHSRGLIETPSFEN